MKYIVYRTKNKVNKKIYVGVHGCEDPNKFDGYIGNGIYITQPSSYNKPTRAFQFAVKKHGTAAFERETIAIFDSSEEAYDMESKIVTYDFLKRDDVYNIALGGLGGSSNYVSIYQFDLTGKLVKTWNSLVEAGMFYGISDTAIRNKCNYKKSLNDFYFSYEDSIDVSEYSLTVIGTPCYKYSESGKYLDTYESVRECCIQNQLCEDDFKYNVLNNKLMKGDYYSFDLDEEYKSPKVNLKKMTVYIYDLEGNYITETKNDEDRKKFFNTNHIFKVNRAIYLKRNYNQYQFSLEYKESLPKFVMYNKSKKVGQYTMDGNLVKIFDTQRQAEKEFGSGIRKVIQGVQKQCHGYIFRIISQ